jgi:hypothetical protein
LPDLRSTARSRPRSNEAMARRTPMIFFFICLISAYAITEGMILFPWSWLLLLLIFVVRGSASH